MNKFKTLALLVTLLVALTGAGCKNAKSFKSFFESSTTKKVAKEVVPDVVERAAGFALDDKSDNTTNTKNSGKSPVTKAGAVVAGAAAATAGSIAAGEQSIMKADNNKVNRSSDDTLGGIKLGDSLSYVTQSLGDPIKKTDKGKNQLRYEYQAMDVAYDSGFVIGLATDLKNVSTPRGIHAGSSLNDVLDKYGKNYILSAYNNLNLYEYKLKEPNSKSYILRFAVNQENQKVKYISLRYDE